VRAGNVMLLIRKRTRVVIWLVLVMMNGCSRVGGMVNRVMNRRMLKMLNRGWNRYRGQIWGRRMRRNRNWRRRRTNRGAEAGW
jgi:hypothetical protein